MSFCDIIKKYTDFFEKNFTANLTGDKIRDMIVNKNSIILRGQYENSSKK